MDGLELIKIIDSGPGWLVVDKASDVSVHNEPGRALVSLVRERIECDAELAQRLACQKGAIISPVHRLDRETSGVMLLGVNPETVRWFSLQFEERRISKKYVAVVHGCFKETDGPEEVWDSPLSPEAGGRDNPAGKGRKVPCTTRIQVLDQSPHYTLIACSPLTGRKHQIRRHAKLAGHPVLGDTRYGSKRAVEVVRTRHSFSRLPQLRPRVPVGVLRSITSARPTGGKPRWRIASAHSRPYFRPLGRSFYDRKNRKPGDF